MSIKRLLYEFHRGNEEKPLMTDVDLSCSDGHIFVHSLILMDSSPIFMNYFDRQNFNSLDVTVIHLPDHEVKIVTQVMDMLYTSRCVVSESDLDKTFAVLKDFGISLDEIEKFGTFSAQNPTVITNDDNMEDNLDAENSLLPPPPHEFTKTGLSGKSNSSVAFHEDFRVLNNKSSGSSSDTDSEESGPVKKLPKRKKKNSYNNRKKAQSPKQKPIRRRSIRQLKRPKYSKVNYLVDEESDGDSDESSEGQKPESAKTTACLVCKNRFLGLRGLLSHMQQSVCGNFLARKCSLKTKNCHSCNSKFGQLELDKFIAHVLDCKNNLSMQQQQPSESDSGDKDEELEIDDDERVLCENRKETNETAHHSDDDKSNEDDDLSEISDDYVIEDDERIIVDGSLDEEDDDEYEDMIPPSPIVSIGESDSESSGSFNGVEAGEWMEMTNNIVIQIPKLTDAELGDRLVKYTNRRLVNDPGSTTTTTSNITTENEPSTVPAEHLETDNNNTGNEQDSIRMTTTVPSSSLHATPSMITSLHTPTLASSLSQVQITSQGTKVFVNFAPPPTATKASTTTVNLKDSINSYMGQQSQVISTEPQSSSTSFSLTTTENLQSEAATIFSMYSESGTSRTMTSVTSTPPPAPQIQVPQQNQLMSNKVSQPGRDTTTTNICESDMSGNSTLPTVPSYNFILKAPTFRINELTVPEVNLLGHQQSSPATTTTDSTNSTQPGFLKYTPWTQKLSTPTQDRQQESLSPRPGPSREVKMEEVKVVVQGSQQHDKGRMIGGIIFCLGCEQKFSKEETFIDHYCIDD